jgi:hypothetical protein
MRLRLAVVLLAAMALAACGSSPTSGGPSASKLYTSATPEPGTDIPSASVKFGLRPYADNDFYVIGMREGWYRDVGITITPEPYGLKTTEEQWVSILLSRQVDINTATCSILLPSYRTTDQLKCLGLAVTFYGEAMLANPKLHLKTVADYAKAGLGFDQALHQALSPLVGQTVYVPAGVAAKEFEEVPFELGRQPLPHYVNMDDPQMLLLAKSDRIDFAFPAGAPIAETLLEAGWTPVYDSGQLLRYGPGGVSSPLEPLVSNNGFAATADYVDAHQTTVLRFASVMFRIFAALDADPSLFNQEAPYLNSVAGTSLDGSGVQRTVDNLDPFVPFEAQTKYFVDTTGPEYYANSMGALIKALQSAHTITAGVTPDQVIWAAPIYRELVSYQHKADSLFQQARSRQLSADKQQLIQKAHQYYRWYDFLDAYRLANAAMA